MHFPKSLQGSKWAKTTCLVSTESTLLFLLIWNFFGNTKPIRYAVGNTKPIGEDVGNTKPIRRAVGNTKPLI